MYPTQNGPVNQGYAQQAPQYPDAPLVQTRLSSIAAHQESLNSEVASIVEKFDRLADRLCGSQPKEAPRPETGLLGAISGLANVIEGHQERSALLVNRLRVALERLETL